MGGAHYGRFILVSPWASGGQAGKGEAIGSDTHDSYRCQKQQAYSIICWKVSEERPTSKSEDCGVLGI